MKKLNPKIREKLNKDTKKSLNAINIAITRKKYLNPSLTSNAAAYLYALENKINILKYLDNEDKICIASIEKTPTTKIKVTQKNRAIEKKIIDYITFETDDPFIKGHIKEINKSYTYGCFTSVVILTRKVIENLIIDILIKFFPPNTKSNKELYYDTSRGRSNDFSQILDNFYQKKNEFGIKKEIVERLCEKAKNFKDNANNKTHSWFHLVTNKTEVDDLEAQTVIELIKKLLK